MTARRAAAQSPHTTTPETEAREQALAERVAVEARALIELEFQRVRERTSIAMSQTRALALIGAAAVACAVLSLGAVTTALLLAVGASVVPALVLAGIVLFSGSVIAGYSYLVLPDSPLEHARTLARTGFAELRRQLKPRTPSIQRG